MNSDDRRFCVWCGAMKEASLFYSTHQCNSCRSYHKKLYYCKLPRPESVWQLLHNSTKAKRKRHKIKLTRADKARICELYIGFSVPIKLIATMEAWHKTIITKVISEYLGTGLPPVTMQINFADTDDITT